VPLTSPHSDVPRTNCMQSQQTYFTKSHKLVDTIVMAYVNSQDMTFGKGVEIQSYGFDEQTAYRHECETKNGRFVTFTGTLDCVGFDEFTFATKTYTYQNYGYCFPPLGNGACDYYPSAPPWLIDRSYVEKYACTVRAEEDSTTAGAAVGGGGSTVAVPPPPTSVSLSSTSSSSIPGPSLSSLSSNRTGKDPSPPSSLDTTTATNGDGLAVGAAAVLLLAVFVGTIIFHQRRRRQNQWTLTGDIDDDMELQDLDLSSSSVGPTVPVSRIS
jgi:hypothetical protein